MKFTVTETDGIAVIAAATPRLDASEAPAFKQAIMELLDRGVTRIVVDLSQVDFMDSSGLSCLLSCRKSVGPDGALALAGMAPKVGQLFRITKLDQGVFPLFADVDEALTSLRR